MAIAVGALAVFPIGFAGALVLVPIGAAAGIVLLILRPRLTRREISWAVVLAVLATAGGLVEWSTSWRLVDLGIALAQLPLVFLTLCAGWAIARRVGWLDAGIDSTAYVSRGKSAACGPSGSDSSSSHHGR